MKRYNIHFTPDAIKDLDEIYQYIAEESGFPERAWDFVERLHQKCLSLETAPFRGHVRDDLMKGLRITPLEKNTVAAFMIDEPRSLVLVLNIFYGGRDYEAIMTQSSERL